MAGTGARFHANLLAHVSEWTTLFSDQDEGPSSHYHDLGLISKLLSTDSNEPFCMLNRQRELTLPRLIAAPTATNSAYV